MTHYTPIRSILYDLSLTINDKYWNEEAAMQWATQGLRKLNILSLLEDKVALIPVEDHKAIMPTGYQYLTQAAYAEAGTTTPTILDPNDAVTLCKDLTFKPLRLSSSPFHTGICLNKGLGHCPDCVHSFTISPSGVITTTLAQGSVFIAYKAYPSENGEALVPDDEDIKEAIIQHVLYRYWMSKYQMKEEGADQRMQFHLSQWIIYSKKCMSTNLPDVNTLENIKNLWNRLVPKQNKYNTLFVNLNSQDNAY